ncbi:MAG: hypothetical protein L0956_02355 [Candidatus Mariimomonas ferrooxydans]
MRKLILFLLVVFSIFILSNKNTDALDNKKHECIKCHTLDAEKAKTALKELIPDIKIISVKDGPVTGMWEVGFESGGRKSLLYLDYPLKHVIAGGNVILVKTKVNLTRKSLQEINKVDLSLIPYENALVLGSKDAKLRVVVFDDPD